MHDNDVSRLSIDGIVSRQLRVTANATSDDQTISCVFSTLPAGEHLRQMPSPPQSVEAWPDMDVVSAIATPAGHPFRIRIADAPGIGRDAAMLVNERYVRRGYGEQSMDADDSRLTVVAYDAATPIGTLTVGLDTSRGLRCDALYRSEIDSLRHQGRKVCEFTRLAVSANANPLAVLASLFHVAFIHAYKVNGYDDVIVEVNPRHVKFYQRALGFAQIGGVKPNKHVNAPAILLHCSFAHIENQLRFSAGTANMQKRVRTIYPYGFSRKEEDGILQRIRALKALGAQEEKSHGG